MLKRRDFLKVISAVILGEGLWGGAFAAGTTASNPSGASLPDAHVKDYLHKMLNYDDDHAGDIFLNNRERRLLNTTRQRLRRLQEVVGHGNFYLLNFDDALKTGHYYTKVGAFTPDEIEFLEQIFYRDACCYGFLGHKPLQSITDRIDRTKAVPITQTGNYVYQGLSLETFEKIKKDVGEEVVLTSGLRSIPKQFLLFLNKVYQHRGNLSLASRSLAPPGYSYHGIGDFDVGHIKLGSDNFTLRFTETDIYRQLQDLGYVELRYRQDNELGVRFEPWHIKVQARV